MRWIVTGLTAALLWLQPLHAAKPIVGEVAPDFELTLVDGAKVKLSEMRGQVVVLNLWATWCVPCKRELPLLDAYYKINQKHGMRVFALTTEDSVPIFQLKKLFAVLAISSARKIKGGYATLGGVPINYVFDRSGRLRYAKAGAFELEDLNKIIIPLLNERGPAVLGP